MKQVCVQWQNMTDNSDNGLIIGSLPMFIGRAEQNDVVLTASSSGVSRRHARLAQVNGHVVLTDLHSTNGTFSNGEQVGEMTMSQQTPFYIGLYRLTIETYMHCQNDACDRLIAHHHTTCPWCGHFTADAQTRVLA